MNLITNSFFFPADERERISEYQIEQAPYPVGLFMDGAKIIKE